MVAYGCVEAVDTNTREHTKSTLVGNEDENDSRTPTKDADSKNYTQF